MCFAVLISIAVFLIVLSPKLSANEIDNPRAHPAIPLLDEDGNHVLNSNKPYSAKQSCQECHDYEKITHAYHFETGRDEARDDFGKQSGLLNLVSPGYFGGYNCMGSNAPDALAKKFNAKTTDFSDYGAAGYIQRCANCHAGGGWMEKDRDGVRYDKKDLSTVPALDGDYYNRATNTNNEKVDDKTVVSQWNWHKSGVVENDCLLCHVDFAKNLKSMNPLLGEIGRHGISRKPRDLVRELRGDGLIKVGHFRYGGSAMLEFLNLNMSDDASKDQTLLSFIRGATEQVEGEEVLEVKNLKLDANGNPQIKWNMAAFDDKMKVTLPMIRYPSNTSCMLCHSTANSRRGFYGFDDNADIEYEEGGQLVEDYKDDVHKGLIWTEDNGEKREIKNCNACHAKNYFKPAYTNVDVDADHNFAKGNSDMDLHNELDYEKDPKTGRTYVKSCQYCHEDARNPAIPSGHDSMLAAHREKWRASGDMYGYGKNELDAITQKHLDVVSCEACHITNKAVRGKPFDPLYRYAKSADGKLRIRPYKPKPRHYWQNKSDRYIFSKTERNSVFEVRKDNKGKDYGVIIDPVSKKVLAEVSARISHGSWRFGDPKDYAGFVALKKAYDSLLRSKGVSNPDAVMIVSEINQYVLSHGTKPATQSLQCEQCHEKKQNGTFSSLISPNGLLGAKGNRFEVASLPDKRLVDEGLIILDYPYMKITDTGTVVENVDDILYYTGKNPSLSRLQAQKPEDMDNGGIDAVIRGENKNNGGGNGGSGGSNNSGGSGGGTFPLALILFTLFLLIAQRLIRKKNALLIEKVIEK
jgi:hypothetical protein